MSDDVKAVFKGDSDSKRVARARIWMHSGLGATPKGAPVLVLSGPDAADVRLLARMGVPIGSIVAVDRDRAALDSARAKVPGAQYVHGDILDVCRANRRKFSAVFLDLCAQMGERSVELVAACAAHGVRDDGVVLAGFSFGRETGATKAAVSFGREVTKKAIPVETGVAAALGLTPGRCAPEDAALARLGSFRVFAARSFAKRAIGFRLLATSVGYTSRTAAGPGTPMLLVGGVVTRGSAYGVIPPGPRWTHYQVSAAEAPQVVRESAVEMARKWGSAWAADVLNLSEPTVRAWLAVATRTSAPAAMSPPPNVTIDCAWDAAMTGACVDAGMGLVVRESEVHHFFDASVAKSVERDDLVLRAFDGVEPPRRRNTRDQDARRHRANAILEIARDMPWLYMDKADEVAAALGRNDRVAVQIQKERERFNRLHGYETETR